MQNQVTLEIYDPEKTYVYPNMTVATPERIQLEYSAINIVKCVITTDPTHTMFCAYETFASMAQRLGVEIGEKTDAQVLYEMEGVLNIPTPDQGPSAEERIAAAMEYQNLVSM